VIRPLFVVFSLLPLAAAFADTVTLKSGEVVEGRITSAPNADPITIEVQFSPTIVDRRQISRAEIAKLSQETPDSVAFKAIESLTPPSTALKKDVYDAPLGKLLEFLRKFPDSPHAEVVREKVNEFQEQADRIRTGEVKIAGVWLPADSNEKYQIEAAEKLETLKKALASNDFAGAANAFDSLTKSHKESIAYAEAIEPAREATEKLIQQLNFTIGNLPVTLEQRQAAIDRTPPEQRAAIEAAVQAENAQARAVAEQAQKAGIRFFAVAPFDEKGLKDMDKSARQLLAEIEAIDRNKFETGARLINQVSSDLTNGDLAAAENGLTQLKAIWPSYEGLPRLEARLREKQREAEKAAQPTPEPTPTPAPAAPETPAPAEAPAES